MTARIFDTRLTKEWIGFTILRRVIICIAIVHFSLAAVSGYRAVVQIYDVSIDPVTTPVTAGAKVSARVVTAGRTYVAARLELEQAGHSEVIATTQIPQNDSFFYDPRPKHGAISATIPAETVARFSEGSAVLRVVAEGRSQWLHVPPPKIGETVIQLAQAPELH